MAKKKSNNSSSAQTDSRLKSFLRKAEAIIATEKGLNAESRLKLQTLADHVRLPPELFDEALTRLQQNSDPTSNLTHYEKAFVKFLDSEFEKVTSGIISPSVENQAIAMAKSKYEINGTRAEQLIAARAEAFGMSLISQVEAEAFARRSIVDRIGKRIEIDGELHDQIFKIRRRWGLSQSIVERIIEKELERNRAQQKPRLKKLLWASSALLVIAAALIGTAFAAGWIPERWLVQAETHAKQPVDENDSSTDFISASRFPDAFDLQGFSSRTEIKQLIPSLKQILNDDVVQRRSGYRQLVRSACLERDVDEPLTLLASELTCKLFYADPDMDSALEVVNAIEKLMTIDPIASPSVGSLKRVFQGNRLVGQLKYYPTNDKSDSTIRRTAVDDTIRTLINIPLETVDRKEDYFLISETAIATDQWNRVMQTAWSSPNQAAFLMDPLYELTKSKLDPEMLDAYRDDTLVSIMELDCTSWRVLQTQIRRSLKSCDDTRVIDWISIFESSRDAGLRELLAEAILPRINVQPISRTFEHIATAIETFGLEARNQILRPVIDRNELLERFFASTVEFESNNIGAVVSPDRIAQLALAVNVEWAFCAAIENATHIDDSSFVEFDRLIAIPSPRLRELISLPIDRRRTKAAGPTSATASDKRRMNASLERLRDLEPNSFSWRILAIKQLTQIAHRFEGVAYSEAEILARYLLSDLELEELLNVEKLIDAFAHWPNLPLAIADQLSESNVRADQILTISRLLLDRNFDIGPTTDWKRELQIKILAAVSNDVENRVDQDPNNVKSNWIRLKIYLAETYRERLALGANGRYINDVYPSPHQASTRIVESLVVGTTTDDKGANLKRAIQLVHASPANDIEKTAFANQLLVQILIEELSDSELHVESELMLANLRNEFRKQSLAGDQLYATELALLRVVNLKRKTLVQRLLKQDKTR